MRPKFGQQFKVKWLDAFASAEWTDNKTLDKLLKDATPEQQTLYFIKQTPDFYIFTSGKPKPDQYIDIHAMPKGWIVDIKPVRKP